MKCDTHGHFVVATVWTISCKSLCKTGSDHSFCLEGRTSPKLVPVVATRSERHPIARAAHCCLQLEFSFIVFLFEDYLIVANVQKMFKESLYVKVCDAV